MGQAVMNRLARLYLDMTIKKRRNHTGIRTVRLDGTVANQALNRG
jgi:hypothetical protein